MTMMLVLFLLHCAFVFWSCPQVLSERSLHDLVHKFQPIWYDNFRLLDHHRRKRHSTSDIGFSFFLGNALHRVKLFEDSPVFADDFNIQLSTNNHPQPRHSSLNNKFYRGGIDGAFKGDSTVYGTIDNDGFFAGTLRIANESYRIEPARYYITPPLPSGFHSVIWNLADLKTIPQVGASGCLSAKISEKLPKLPSETTSEMEHIKSVGGSNRRLKRASTVDKSKFTCKLYIQADYPYFEFMNKNHEKILLSFGQHVQAANQIFSKIDFDGDGFADGIKFIISRSKIWDDKIATDYPFPEDFYGVEDYLETLAESASFDEYCLAYSFTYREFDGGTLGLAWEAQVGRSGGLCSKSTVYKGSTKAKSLNTGIITRLNFGKEVTDAVSHITFAHEIGHNFGSPHDPEDGELAKKCSPGDDGGGNYVMYARATSGYLSNNDIFSSCSVSSMAEIIDRNGRCDSTTCCLVGQVGAFCGNGIVEEGEACDCGWKGQCTEACCVPMDDSNPSDACQMKSDTDCSPSSGPCCTSACKYARAETVCREQKGCTDTAKCTGESHECPTAAAAPDGTECSEGLTCSKGICNASLCLKFNMKGCQCTDDTFSTKSLCQMCCTDGITCKSSYELESVRDTTLDAGTPCNDYKGYCDVFARCREVNPQGSFAALSNMLFSEEGINNIKDWITTQWYIVAGAGAGFLIILGGFVFVCGKSTKKDIDKLREKYEGKMARRQQVVPTVSGNVSRAKSRGSGGQAPGRGQKSRRKS